MVREFAFAKGDSEQVQSQSGRYHEGMNSSWSRIVRACLVGALSDESEKKACLGGRESIKCFA